MENKIKNFIKRELNITPELMGYDYIVQAIWYIIEAGGAAKVSIVDMYKTIAEENDTNSSAVERSIRHALKRVSDSPDLLKNVGSLFSCDLSNGFTNGRFLALCAEYLMD